MSNIAKQILAEMNQPLHDKLKNEFVNYLIEIEQKKLIDVAEKINWESIVKAFELQINKLLNNLAIPDAAIKLGVRKEFARILFANIKRNLFQSVYLDFKKKAEDGKVNEDDLSNIMDEYVGYGMYEFFKVFDYQFTLSSLRRSMDPKVITKRIEELKDRIEFKNKSVDMVSIQDYEKVFIMIDKDLERREKVGRRWSIRAACDYYAKNELGIGIDATEQFELDKFYKKYLVHTKYSNRNDK